jgi:hypothetical protein
LLLTIFLSYNDHWFCDCVNVLRFCPDRYKLYIVVDPQNLTTCLGLDVLLSNVFRFIIEQPMRVSRPCDTPHIYLKLRLLFLFAFLNDLNLIFGLARSSITLLKHLQLLQVMHVSFIKIIFFEN